MTDFEQRLQRLEMEVGAIHERNLRVEADKAWETSGCRIFLVCSLTYIVIAMVFWLIGVERYLANAIVPTVAFYLSTRSVGFVKFWWLKQRERSHPGRAKTPVNKGF